MLFVPHSGEADGIRMVEVVILLPVGVVLADFQQVVNDAAVHGRIAADAVVIPVKDAGVAVLHEQDQCVGGRLEPVLDG